jgi:hypothetical protein
MPTQNLHDQLVASVVHVQITRTPEPTLTVLPDPVLAFYTHDGGHGDEMKPHRLLWEAFGLQAGERIEIEAHDITGLVVPLAPARVLRALFERETVAPGGEPSLAPVVAPDAPVSIVWDIPYGSTSVESIAIALDSDELGRIVVKYDVRLFNGSTLLAHLDPTVHLVPDP